MSNPLIEYLSFHPVRKVKSLIGFCGFRYNKEITFSEIAVHKLLKPKGHIRIRLLYPEKVVPVSKEIQQSIDEEVNGYILANYPEVFKC